MSVLSTTVHKDSTNNSKHLYMFILVLRKTVHCLCANLQIDAGGQKCTRFHTTHTLHFGVTQFVRHCNLHFKNYLTLNIKICHLGVIIIPQAICLSNYSNNFRSIFKYNFGIILESRIMEDLLQDVRLLFSNTGTYIVTELKFLDSDLL